MATDERYMNETKVSEFLDMSLPTMRRWRKAWKDGKPIGPRPYWFGRSVRYKRAEVLNWADAQAIVTTEGAHGS